MSCLSTPLSVSLLSAWFSCVLSTRQSRIKLHPPQIQIEEEARLRSPLLHGESEDTPVPNAFDPYYMGHNLCWHCLGPPLFKLFDGILFPCPVQYGGCRNTILPEINTKPIAKASPTFFFHSSVSAAITEMFRNSPTPTSTRRLQHAPCSVPVPGEDNSPYLYAMHNKLGRKRRFTLLYGPNVLRTVMKEKRLVRISRQ